jgi:hypothetical protein
VTRAIARSARLLLPFALLVGALGAAGPAQAEPLPGTQSNMGLCSPFLAGLPSPIDPITGEALGGNARSGVNQLIIRYGELQPDALSNPGELYKIRARQHPSAPAEAECLPRRQP